ncbi:MAG: hypothetical protein K2G77_08910 [Muribaculaceae bacterium]|nr:hypothetical protein [Muribaculaceae bacterium]
MNPFDQQERHNIIISKYDKASTLEEKKKLCLYLNLIDIDFDTPIYRYMKWEYLKSFYEDPGHQWILVNPSKWQDKYEHFIFKCDAFYNTRIGKNIGIDHIASQFFAQCWTLTEESSMQWQVNKPHSNSAADNNPGQDGGEIWVKIRTTPRKLLEEMLYSSNNLVEDSFNIITYFLGKVKYVDDDFIRNYEITTPEEIIDPNGLQQVLFLLWKRKPYQCENEVRLIMQVDSEFIRKNKSTLVRRPIDNWYELIDEIVIDPWATDMQVKEVTDFINVMAANENKLPISVWKSHLNDVPRYLIPYIAY